MKLFIILLISTNTFFCIGQEKKEELTVNIKDVNANRWSANIKVNFFYNFFVN